MGSFITGIVIFLVFLLLMRFIGSWLFRIDDVIDNQRKIIEELKKMNANRSNKE